MSVSVLREAIREAAGRSSANAVAQEVGMSTRSLLDFIYKETEPRGSTLRKYTMWYLRCRQRTGGTVDKETAAAALALLLEHVPSRKRAEARAAFLDWVEQTSREAGVEVPGWVGELRSD